jgi:O-antigen/teichoic acid export membrane protein
MILLIFLDVDRVFFAIVALLFATDALFELQYSVYRGKGEFEKEAYLKLFIAFIYLALTFCIYYYSLALLDSLLFLALFYSLFALFSLFRMKNLLKPKLDFSLLSYHENWFILLASIFTIAYLRIDILMIEYFLSPKEVAIYSIAAKIVEVAMVLPFVISNIFLTKIINENSSNFKPLFVQILLGIFVSLLFFVTSPYLIRLFFNSYEMSIILIKILSLGLVFVMANNYIFTLFLAKNSAKKFFYVTFFMFMANFILNAIFIPRYGIEASAWTTIATEAFGFFVAIKFFMEFQAKNR